MARPCDLPEGLLEEIMSWLAPESLKGFKCVSKSWYAFINGLMNDPEFVAKHLRNMQKKMMSPPTLYFQNLMVVDFSGGQGGSVEEETYLLTLANDDDQDWDDIPRVNEKLNAFVEPTPGGRIEACHCNGIICLSKICGEDNFVLVNPSLKEIKIVPFSLTLVDCYEVCGVGFGYDSRTNDYKVVVIWSQLDDIDGLCTAQVYNLSTNSWRDIQIHERVLDFDYYQDFVDYQVVYLNGVCYWYYWNDKLKITSFDFADEVFRNISVPDLAKSEDRAELADWTKIGVWNESLVLFYYDGDAPIVIEMWVMNVYSCDPSSVEGSLPWIKYAIIGPVEGVLRPLVMWDDHQLFLETEDAEIISYSLYTQELDDRSSCLEQFRSHSLVFYVKSLVSLLNRDGRGA